MPAASTAQHYTDGPANPFPARVLVKEPSLLKTSSDELTKAAATTTGEIAHHAVPTKDSATPPEGHRGTAPEMVHIGSHGATSGIGLYAAPGSNGSSPKNPVPKSNRTAVSSGAQESPEDSSWSDHSPMLSAPGLGKASSTTPPKTLE